MEKVTGNPVQRQEYLNRSAYLYRLRREFGIDTIYYPGCGDDRKLEKAFDADQIFYADTLNWGITGRVNFKQGDMAKQLYPNGTFDAMFYQDGDVMPAVFRAALRAVKRNGVLVFSTDDKGCRYGVQLKQLAEFAEIIPMNLPYRTQYFHPFRKLS